MATSREFDCQRCGACCCSPHENRAVGIADWVQVRPDDPVARDPRLARRYLVVGFDGETYLRMDKHFRCAALRGTVGRAVECSIYDARPAPCHRMEPGSPSCLAHRKQHGVGDGAGDGAE